jgi:hypothetical protein
LFECQWVGYVNLQSLGFTLRIHKRKRVPSQNWTINQMKEGGKELTSFTTVSEIIIRSQGKGFLHFLRHKRKNVLPLYESKIIYKRTEPTSEDQDFFPSFFSKKKKTVTKNLMMGMYSIVVWCLVVVVVVQGLLRYILECSLSSCCHFLTVVVVVCVYFLINI